MKSFTSVWTVPFALLYVPFTLFAQSPTVDVPPAVDSLIQLSRGHTGAGEFERAYHFSAQAGELTLACCGEYSAAYAAYCFNEGRIRDFQENYEEAIDWYQRARTLRAELLGKLHVDYGKSLNNLAIIYSDLGRYAEAETLYRESLAVREHNFGKDSGAYAKVLGNLSTLYLDQDDYAQAEPLMLEALAIKARTNGKHHQEYATSLDNLANLYYETGNTYRALDLLLEAKEVYDGLTEPSFYRYVNVLERLGALWEKLGDYAQAETYYTAAAEYRARILGTDHPDYAWSLNHLGKLYLSDGRLEQADHSFTEALHILERAGNDTTLLYGYTLQDLGAVHEHHQAWDAALAAHAAALKLLGRYLPRNHLRYLLGLHRLAALEQGRGRLKAAAAHLRLLAELSEERLSSAVGHMTEAELAKYIAQFEGYLHQYLTLATEYPALADLCYDKILTYKGFLLTKVWEARRRSRHDDQVAPVYDELNRLHAELGTLYTTADASQERVTALEEQQHALEKQLVLSGALPSDAVASITWRDVRDELSAEEAAVEFVRYADGATDNQNYHYAALIVVPDAEIPHFIPLGEEARLDDLLNAHGSSTAAFINQLYAADGAGRELYALIWEPIAAWLARRPTITTLYQSPVGLLHRINLGALPYPGGGRLAERYHLLTLGSTRAVVQSREESPPDADAASLLYGGIDYGSVAGLTSGPETGRGDGRGRYVAHRGYDPDQGYWQHLAWTEVEVLTAEELLDKNGYQPLLKMGKVADEASLKTLTERPVSPRMLHLATHGFFFPDPTAEERSKDLAFRGSERAMIRSGLVLADGNYAWANGRARDPQGEDGILTAYEVSKMNLATTELVILSACETGLGDIRGTEGVYGLQRAFKIAGARYLIMTLWQVPDFQAQAFMTTFYLAWLSENQSIPEAFHTAQSYMRARYGDAFEWAGFVLIE